MMITVDTNILVRAAIGDDPKQTRAARGLMAKAELIALPLSCLCEFVWVLRRVYHLEKDEIISALSRLVDARNVSVDRRAVEAGLAALQDGGDFADGVIAYDGSQMGGTTFVSFDKKAVSLVLKQGRRAEVLKQ